LNNRLYDFKFPNLVRAIESIIGLKAGQGQSAFSRRADMFLAKPELQFAFEDGMTRKMLKESYQIRNDCMHGKPFGWSLGGRKRHPILKEKSQMYEYLLETAARGAIRTALTDAELLEAFSHRTKLDELWDARDPEFVRSKKLDRLLEEFVTA